METSSPHYLHSNPKHELLIHLDPTGALQIIHQVSHPHHLSGKPHSFQIQVTQHNGKRKGRGTFGWLFAFFFIKLGG